VGEDKQINGRMVKYQVCEFLVGRISSGFQLVCIWLKFYLYQTL